MVHQHSHDTTPFVKTKSHCVVLCDGVSGPANVGGLFRICDAMGVRELIFCNAEIDFNSPRLQRTSRNTHTTVPFRTSEAISTEIENYQEKDFLPVALELSNNSIPLQTLETPKKLLLILGNERHGISAQILEMVKVHTYIPLMGKNSSMNVVQAASIALYALTKL